MFASPVFWQIRELVRNLTKKNLKSSVAELNQLVSLYGHDSKVFLIHCLLDAIDLGQSAQKDSSWDTAGRSPRILLLQHEIAQAANSANFVSILCQALERSGRVAQSDFDKEGFLVEQDEQSQNSSLTAEYLTALCKTLKLGLPQAISMGLALVHSRSRFTRAEASKFLRLRAAELASGGSGTLNVTTLKALLEYLNPSLDAQKDNGESQELIKRLQEVHQILLGGKVSKESYSANGVAPPLDLTLLPMFAENTEDMNFMNRAAAVSSLRQDIAALSESITSNDLSLAGFLGDMGPASSASSACFRGAIQQSGINVDERQMARLLIMLMKEHRAVGADLDMSNVLTSSLLSTRGESSRDDSSTTSTWNLEAIRQVIVTDYALKLNWQLVAREFDHSSFYVPDHMGLAVLLQLYRSASQIDIPVEVMFGRWLNKNGHLSLLRACITSPPQLYSFLASPRKQQTLDGMDASSAGTPNEAWLSLDLIALLLNIALDAELYGSVKETLSAGAYACPELMLLGLAAIPPATGGQLRRDLLTRLLPRYFRPNSAPNLVPLLRRLYSVNPVLLTSSCEEAFHADSAALPVVVHILKITRIVPEVFPTLLSSDDVPFAICLACVAYGAERPNMPQHSRLDLEAWASERLRRDGEVFAGQLLAFLRANVATAMPREVSQDQAVGEKNGDNTSVTCTLCIEALAECLRAVAGPPGASVLGASVQLRAAAQQVADAAQRLHPSIAQLLGIVQISPPEVAANQPPKQQQVSSAQKPPEPPSNEVMEIANAYFQRIYTNEQSIPDILEMLKRYQVSEDKSEQNVFACMVQNLFDEYRFFSKYPEKELRITGILFGKLIKHGLVSSITLGIALRYVLEALCKPPGKDADGKMFRFGMFALEHFKERLGEWPQYCQHIAQIPHLAANHADLVREIEHAMVQQEHVEPMPIGLTGIPQINEVVPQVSDPSRIIKMEQQQISLHPTQQILQLQAEQLKSRHAQVQQTGGYQILRGVPVYEPQPHRQSARETMHEISSREAQLAQQMQQMLGIGGSSAAPKVESRQVSHQSMSEFATREAQLAQQMQNMLGLGGPPPNQKSSIFSNIESTSHVIKVENMNASTNLLAALPAITVKATKPVEMPVVQEQPAGLDVPDIESIMLSSKEPEAQTPPDAIMDRIHFIINNVSPSNLEQKVNEIRAQISGHPEFYAWMANYLVGKRISTQPNFHALYLQFIDSLEAPELADAVLRSVFFYVGKLLRSSKIITSTSERSLLKNLGSWLGQTTLARNRPVLQRQLDLKELLFRGYETGRLIAVTPFVAKVLEGAQNSVVFQPPNPWLMGLLSALHEMYDLEDLKMNIKFEVEMLVKKLNIRLEEVPKYGRLSRRRSPIKDKNPDFNVRPVVTQSASPPLPSFVGQASAGTSLNAFAPLKDEKSMESAFAMGLPGGVAAASSASDYTVIPNLSAYVTVNDNMDLFEEFPQLKRFVPLAVDRAIREIIQPVVERSVTIAGITTKELILKDFATEGDENKLRKASHLMVSNLAGSLALVTCKEPLRVAIGSYLRNLCLDEIPTLDLSKLELAVQMSSTDNLELGCMLIEKAATEKAMRDIDESLIPAQQSRRKHRETTNQHYYDTSLLHAGRYPSALPESLRLKPGGLQPSQLMVYDAFQRLPRISTSRSTTAMPTPQSAAHGPVGGARSTSAGAPGMQKIEMGIENALMAWKSAMARLEMALQMIVSQMANAGHAGELSLVVVGNDIELSSSLHEIVAVGQKVPVERREDALLLFAQNVFQRLFDMTRGKEDNALEIHLLRVEVFVAVLELCLRDLKRYTKEEVITRWYTQRPPAAMLGEGERKLQKAALTMFVRAKMLRLSELDLYIARAIENNGILSELSAVAWAEFGLSLVRQCVFDQATQTAVGLAPSAIIKEFAHVLDALSRTSQRTMGIKKQFERLMVDLRMVAGQPSHPQQMQIPSPMHLPMQMTMQGSDQGLNKMMGGQKLPVAARSDPAGIRDQVASILEYWVRLSGERPGDEKSYGPFLTLLQQKGSLKTDEATERFFRVATEVVVEACLKNARPPPPQPSQDKPENGLLIRSARSTISYVVVDAYVKLLVLLIKSVNTGNLAEATQARLSLLNKVLSTIVRALLQDVEAHKVQPELPAFDQRPYFRLLLGLLQDFNTPDRVLDSSNLQVLAAFASAFHVLQPIAAPSFAFAWLELISHRMFMPTLLLARHQKGWMLMHRLIIDLLCFMEPRLRRFELGDAVRTLYRGMLRVLLVLLHDFPEFLCEYHFSLCDVIPPCCIQLRNLVLSAFPRSMRLPDPFTPNLKVDLLPEIGQAPRILSNFTTALININLRGDLDKYLQSRSNTQFLLDLPNRLRLPPNEVARAGSQHNIPAISALVVYVGHMAISQMQNKGANITHSAPMDVFQHLSAALDSEARYFFFNAIANQLRFPNNHTHYFSCVLLYLFAEATAEEVREQITRILLERLIVHRPHPWGLLITFIELIKNPRYDFWSHRFTHCAPELERVFESVARSCMAPQGQVPGAEGVLEGSEGGLQQAM